MGIALAFALGTVLAGGPGLAPALFQDPGVPPEPAMGGPSDGQERPRFRFGLLGQHASLNGRIEKERSSPLLGSGGDKIGLRSDLDLPHWSWIPGTEVAIEPGPSFRIRGAMQGDRMRGDDVLDEGFRHGGNLFLAGDLVRTKFEYVMGDAEFHMLPRQAERNRGEFGLFVGVRAFQFRHVVQSSTARVSERTLGVMPRFGLQFWASLGSGMTIHGGGAVGGWANGTNNNFYAAADGELWVGLGYRWLDLVDVRFGFRHHSAGIWRERSTDMERVSIERSGAFLSCFVRI